jgi:hypothetical protein
MANMAYTFLEGVAGGGLFILLHTAQQPASHEWQPYNTQLAEVDQRIGVENTCTLVLTDGATPNGEQRKLVADLLKGRSSNAAVVTSNPVVRGAVTALSWFNSKIKAFSSEQVDAAMRHLGIQSHEIGQVRRELILLNKKLGGIPMKCLSGIVETPTQKKASGL